MRINNDSPRSRTVIKSHTWRSDATIQQLKARAEIIAKIRDFFNARHVWEVETPLLCRHGSCDPFLKSWRAYVDDTTVAAPHYYLQTSPEYAMKRLLACGSGSIYQISKAFRGDEQGRYHNPEFTLLEWYRVDWNYQQLMQEVLALIQLFLPEIKVTFYSYRELFLQHFNIDPWQVTAMELQQIAEQRAMPLPLNVDTHDKDMWLMWLMAMIIEPTWLEKGLVFVYDYPSSQAILAELAVTEYGTVAKRFEAYLYGVELANGFQELQQAKEQRQRFLADNAKRQALGLPVVTIDENLLAALAVGLPSCAGVALGIDRLVLSILQKTSLSQVMAFSFSKV